MSVTDLLMILGCLVIGYAAVSMVLRKPGPPPAASQPEASPPLAPPHWSEILEIDRDAGVDEIREAYRRLISQYHPDKVAALGRELQALAEAKSKDITTAYQDALMARRAGG